MSIVILQDEIVHYEVLGRGRPLIFLHGWVGSWRYWIPSMQAASISFRTYAIDLWGFGDSAKGNHLYGLDQQVNLLERFLQELGIGKIAMIGHGLGALVALLYTARNAAGVDRLMAIGMPDSQNGLNSKLASAGGVDLNDWLLGRLTASDSLRLEAAKTDPRAVEASLAALQQIDARRLAQSFITPCLLVYGQNDPLANGASGDEEPAALPEHIHQIVFDGSGHFPMLEETNKFNRLVADFLSLNSGASPKQLQLKDEWIRRVR